MRIYKCPIDRTNKNGFLPSLETVPLNSFTDEVKGSIEAFLVNFKHIINNNSDIFVELIKSLSGLIVSYEVRLRSLPGCLDSINTRILSRNLFLTTWMAYRINNKPKMTDKKPGNEEEASEIDDEKLTLFQQFIKKLIECDQIDNSSFHIIVESFLSKITRNSERKEKELFLFLRWVCLANYFLLENDDEFKNSNDSELIEWDDVLSIENLSKQFKIKFDFLNEFFEFRPFAALKLPKDFLHLRLEPYNLPVEETSRIHLLNLFDYNYLIENFDDFDEKEMKEKYEIVDNLHPSFNFPSVYTFVGQHASRVVIIYERYRIDMIPFYLDMFGSPDIEFSRNRPLMLNEERYEILIDEIISGDFTKKT